jgi:acetylornithine deacetylase/succinyl-diaminopimelate desuccinylase-like protein
MGRQNVIRSLQAYYDEGRFLADLRHRVAIPTESQNPSRRPELYQYLESEIAPSLRSLDYAVTIYDNPDPAGGPFLVGRRIEDPDALTVLTYGHGDVVRGLDEDWRRGLSPWTITLDGDRIYGRGVVDNKGQHTINIAALAEVIAARGRLAFNSIFFVEMSEEVGSPGIHAFAKAHLAGLAADLLIGSDGPRVTVDRPTIYLGSRGAMNLELTLNLRKGGHHSGNWGGLLANPGIILAHAIASIVSKTGEILVPELRPKQLPPSVRKALEDIAIDGGTDGPEINPWWGEPGLSAAEKVYGWNTFEVLAYITGNPDDAVNAVPPWASAHCQIRFTVDSARPISFPLCGAISMRTALRLFRCGRHPAGSCGRQPGLIPIIQPSNGRRHRSSARPAGCRQSCRVSAPRCQTMCGPTCLACRPSGYHTPTAAARSTHRMSTAWAR